MQETENNTNSLFFLRKESRFYNPTSKFKLCDDLSRCFLVTADHICQFDFNGKQNENYTGQSTLIFSQYENKSESILFACLSEICLMPLVTGRQTTNCQKHHSRNIIEKQVEMCNVGKETVKFWMHPDWFLHAHNIDTAFEQDVLPKCLPKS